MPATKIDKKQVKNLSQYTNTPVKTANYSAVNKDRVLVDTTGGALNVTLPAGVEGMMIIVQDVGGSATTNNITVIGTINGSVNYIIADNFGNVELLFSDGDWIIVSKEPSGGGGGSAHVIEDEGTPVTQRSNINFEGAGVTVDDFGGKTRVTIPGGGGATYPDQVSVLLVDTTLNTTTNQGIIFIAGGKPTLPATAPDGTTYKFVGANNDMIIDTNGKTISNYGSGTDVKIGVAPFTIFALNVPTLTWFPISNIASGNYLVDRIYRVGDIVNDTGVKYISIADSNVGNLTNDVTKWFKLEGSTISHSEPLKTFSNPVNCTSPNDINAMAETSGNYATEFILIDVNVTVANLLTSIEVSTAYRITNWFTDSAAVGSGTATSAGANDPRIPVQVYSLSGSTKIVVEFVPVNTGVHVIRAQCKYVLT